MAMTTRDYFNLVSATIFIECFENFPNPQKFSSVRFVRRDVNFDDMETFFNTLSWLESNKLIVSKPPVSIQNDDYEISITKGTLAAMYDDLLYNDLKSALENKLKRELAAAVQRIIQR